MVKVTVVEWFTKNLLKEPDRLVMIIDETWKIYGRICFCTFYILKHILTSLSIKTIFKAKCNFEILRFFFAENYYSYETLNSNKQTCIILNENTSFQWWNPICMCNYKVKINFIKMERGVGIETLRWGEVRTGYCLLIS